MRAFWRRMGRRGERGLTMVEVLSTLAIGSLVLSTVYLATGTAIRSKMLVTSKLHNQQHGRIIVQWLGNRVRQAGYAVNTASPIPRCRDALVVEDASFAPTATRLYVNTDLANDGTTETIGFQMGTETVGATTINIIQELVTNCAAGATERVSSVTDPTSVRIISLTFTYYDAAGAVVTDLTTPASIRSIRMVRITLVERASAGAAGEQEQTWSVQVNLRNPDPRTL